MAVSPIRKHQSTLEAAGYIRVSLQRQAEGHSPDVQREAIKRLAAQEGYALTMVEEDHERGSKVTRVGYQRVIESVRQGTTHAVIVFMFDRWGRDGAEWLMRAREFERLGVPIISVQEGRDEGGLIRFMRAGMAEEYSRQLAKRVLPGRERGAQSGTHMGKTPLGYRREYGPPLPNGKRPAGELLPDEATAWIVRELFTRYAAGGWSIRGLVDWLNTDDRIVRPSGKDYWTVASIKALLHNPTYTGRVRFNLRPNGLYERAPEGSTFVVAGRHAALIDDVTFDRVQHRLAAGALRKSYNRHGDSLLAAGLLTCSGCGGPQRVTRKRDGAHYYECAHRQQGKPCAARAYLASLAHTALLAQVGRLRGAPWTPQAEIRITGDGSHAETVAVLHRSLQAERERLRRHTRLMSVMEDDPSPEQIASFREVSAEISVRIRALELQVAELGHRAAQVPDLRELHARLTHAEIPTIVAALARADDTEGLRDLLQSLIVSASVVERRPESHPTWLRVQVVWQPDVTVLLDAGLLRLAKEPAGPDPLAPKHERQIEYGRRYKERHRERINARRRELRAATRSQLQGA
jgi:DNA invertase Pin-like site-specific DNA recombinase